MLPPMFQETVVAGPNGEPVHLVIDPNGNVVPPELVQQVQIWYGFSYRISNELIFDIWFIGCLRSIMNSLNLWTGDHAS